MDGNGNAISATVIQRKIQEKWLTKLGLAMLFCFSSTFANSTWLNVGLKQI